MLSAGEDDGTLVLINDVSGDLGALVTRNSPKEVIDVAWGLFAYDVMDDSIVGELAHE